MFGKVLNSFVGKISQVPPMYSAIKVNGKKLYEYARKGLNIEVEPRKIEIYNIELQNINDNKIDFKVHCSKGTYIRSLCEDIAKKLDTVGYMEELKRLKVGKFEIKDSIEIEELERNKENKEISISYSVGYGMSMQKEAKTMKEIFNEADEKMYENKEKYYQIHHITPYR